MKQPEVGSAGGGFRFPDVRTYELRRTQTGCELHIRFEGTQLNKVIEIENPVIELDEQFLRSY